MASMVLFLKWTVVLLLLGAATTSAYNDADLQMRAQMRALKQFGKSHPDPDCHHVLLGLMLCQSPSLHTAWVAKGCRLASLLRTLMGSSSP